MRIQRITQRVESGIAPTVRAPLGLTGGVARGLADVGGAGGQVSNVFVDIALRKKRLEDESADKYDDDEN